MVSSPPFRRALVANRGEIAVRVCRGLVECGVEPVVVYSDADVDAVHRFVGAVAVGIGGETATESYLRVDRILEAASETGAEAVHPGYGFLSESPGFARAVEDAGLVFIGPTADSMERLGSKRSARAVAAKAGVPVVPGFDPGDDDSGDDASWLAAARGIGFPLLVKASAGGGGKGMRHVEREQDFLELFQAGRREALSAFGDGHMLLEKRVHPARHVEIQILGDAHGDVVSLHERECSVQRRYQKVLEEAPSPAVDEDLRARMGEAAVRLAREVGYRNAGTIEFLLDPTGSFYFLEANTRLQVEHPVTECTTGVDLVHLQIRVAAGERLQDLVGGRDLTPRGHAIEARIYAEEPEHDYLPAAGRLSLVHEPEGPGIRVDSGVRSGSAVSVHYDPMLAKLVVHAPDRETACARLVQALRECAYLGIPTNVDFLRRVVEDPGFSAGELRTDFLDLRPELARGSGDHPPDEVWVAAAIGQALPRAANGGPRAVAERASSAQVWADVAGLRVWEGRR